MVNHLPNVDLMVVRLVLIFEIEQSLNEGIFNTGCRYGKVTCNVTFVQCKSWGWLCKRSKEKVGLGLRFKTRLTLTTLFVEFSL